MDNLMADRAPLSIFETLSAIDITPKLKKKNNLSYLPWSTAWEIVKLHYPDSTYRPIKAENGCNYHTDGRTCWVEVEVTIAGETQSESLAVMDHRNRAIPYEEVTSVDVNKSTKRALTKCCSLFGLGLSLWSGEELSDTAKAAKIAHETAAREKAAEERKALTAANKRISDIAQQKIGEGIPRDRIYEVIQSFTGGKKNPNAITDIEVSAACYEAIANMTTEEE